MQQSSGHLKNNDVAEIVFVEDTNSRRPFTGPVSGTLRDYIPKQSDEVLVAVGRPQLRRNIVGRLHDRGAKFHTFIDDRAILAESVEIGAGSIVCPGTVISAAATISLHVQVNFNCSIGYDTLLGDFTTLSPMSNIMGETILGTAVFVGGSAVILPRIEIADETTIGAGATVMQSIESPITVVGTPASDVAATNPSEDC